jgi:hypothetical protein
MPPPGSRPASPEEAARRFIGRHSGVEGLVHRIGARNAQLVLIAESGRWTRVVLPAPADAPRLADKLKIPIHEGWPEHLRRRVQDYRPDADEWATAPYPERRRPAGT